MPLATCANLNAKKHAIALTSGFVMGLSCPVTLKIKGFSAIVNKET